MIPEMTWKEAVIWALRRRGGQSPPTLLYDIIVEVKGWEMEEQTVQHRIRTALDGLKKDGTVEHVDAGLWRLK